jgi:hypothetical protein
LRESKEVGFQTSLDEAGEILYASLSQNWPVHGLSQEQNPVATSHRPFKLQSKSLTHAALIESAYFASVVRTIKIKKKKNIFTRIDVALM